MSFLTMMKNFTMRSFIVFFCLGVALPLYRANAEGVAIIIHGWNITAGEQSWTSAMQNAIANARLNGDQNFGRITVAGVKGSLFAACTPWNVGLSSSPTGEIVVRVDWTAVANHLITRISVQEVAAVIAPMIYQGQNGARPLAELPIHIIGHSRGGGLVYELARLLGAQGIEVDQITSLDPHPLTSSDLQPLFPAPPVIDTPIALYENVLFADNCWQDISYPKGESVAGAYNRLWTSLPGGYHYHSIAGYREIADHINIALLYLGTIDLATPINDGEATLGSAERAAWFNDYETSGGVRGQRAGFYYTRIAGLADRKSADQPTGGGDRIRDGFNNDPLLGGAGARSPQSWTAANWSSLITLDVLRGINPLGPGAVPLSSGETLFLKYTFRSAINSGTITFYADRDTNPYNDNNLATIGSAAFSSGGALIQQASLEWDTSGLAHSGNFYIYGKITNGTTTRYLYASAKFNMATRAAQWALY